jgi:acyl-CoA synthetase (AMP-forming)/AMP-acid ligase II
MSWNYGPDVVIRQERHFNTRVMPCFADRPSTPYEGFARAVAARPDAEAIVVGDVRLSYKALDEQANRVAAGLVEMGVRAGDRVGMLMSNRLEFVTLLLALMRLGAISLPMGTRLQTPEIAYIVEHSGTTVLAYDGELAPRLPAPSDVPTLRHRVGVGGAGEGSERYETLEQGGHAPPVHQGAEDDISIILYTSGTTGKPKGATITNINLVTSMMNYAYSMKVGKDDRTLLAVPASHVTGLVANILLAWQAQCTLIVSGDFKAQPFLELASRERMTHTLVVPAIYNLLLLQPNLDKFDLSHWRVGGYGGAPMAEATIAALAEKLPKLKLHNIYGSTETTGPVSMLPPEYSAKRPDSAGFTLPCADIVIVGDDGREVPRGTPGELWIRGAMVVPGYWANPEGTAQGFVAGYWRSGDLGTMDAQGFLRIHDRMKDMLNRGGFKIYSVEVENTLREHPAVVESAIVGKPDPVLGERVHAYVCIKDGTTASADELKKFCAARLTDYKVPETYTISTTPLPRNANGKLMKREMRDQLLAQAPK